MKTNNSDSNVFELNDTLWPVVRVNTNDTILDPKKYEETHAKDTFDGDEPYYKDNPFRYFKVDRDKWNDEIKQLAVDFINENIIDMMKPYGVESIQVKKIDSPVYYDYGPNDTDELIFTVVMAPDYCERMKHNLELFRNSDINVFSHYYPFFNDHLWSSKTYLLNEIEAFENRERCLGAYLTLCLVDLGKSEISKDFQKYAFDWLQVHSSAGTVRSILLEYENEPIDSTDERFNGYEDSNEFLELYNDDFAIWELYHNLYNRVGNAWKGYDTLECLTDGDKDIRYFIDAKNDAMRMIFWAIDNDYSLEDLKAMAA